MQSVEGPRQIRDMAQQSGLEKIYGLAFGFLSLLAHGNATKILMESKNTLLSDLVEAARSFLEGIYLIVVNRLRQNRCMSVKEIERVLRLTTFGNHPLPLLANGETPVGETGVS